VSVEKRTTWKWFRTKHTGFDSDFTSFSQNNASFCTCFRPNDYVIKNPIYSARTRKRFPDWRRGITRNSITNRFAGTACARDGKRELIHTVAPLCGLSARGLRSVCLPSSAIETPFLFCNGVEPIRSRTLLLRERQRIASPDTVVRKRITTFLRKIECYLLGRVRSGRSSRRVEKRRSVYSTTNVFDFCRRRRWTAPVRQAFGLVFLFVFLFE